MLPSQTLPDSDPRTRMISLRLSEGQYEILKTRYRTYGARNVSDLARLALQRIMDVSGPAPAAHSAAYPAVHPEETLAKLAELDERVRALETSIALIAQTKP